MSSGSAIGEPGVGGAARRPDARPGTPGVDRLERPDAAARQRRPPHLVDRGVQDASVGRQLLQCAPRGAGPDQRDQIAVLHLLVDEPCAAPCAWAPCSPTRCRGRRRRAPWCAAPCPWSSRPDETSGAAGPTGQVASRQAAWAGAAARQPDVLRERDRLQLAVLPQLEVVRGQVGDEVAVLVGDDASMRMASTPTRKRGGSGLRRRLRADDEPAADRTARSASETRRTVTSVAAFAPPAQALTRLRDRRELRVWGSVIKADSSASSLPATSRVFHSSWYSRLRSG